jgi:two-component system, OmpR family, sensor kinase
MLGGILLIFGVVVYVLVNFILIGQVDDTLARAVNDIIDNTSVSQIGKLSMLQLPDLEVTTNVFVQLWDRQGNLSTSSPSLSGISDPLDSLDLNATHQVYRDVFIQKVHLRVLSVPLEVGGLPIGVMQAATPLNVVDTTRQTLLVILIVVTIVSIFIAAIGSWLGVGQALAPLKTVTGTALQITRADDLSRRIPYNGPPSDEIGTLIRAFNRTLERLENLFTSQQRFLADVSHELRTPLTVIKGNADLIRRFGPDEESLDSIKDEANRLTRLVGDLLILAQAESGKLPLNRQPIDLDSLLLEVFQQMRVLAGEKISLKLTEIDQALVYGDRDRLKQVFINLISNAIHYTPQGGEVFLSLSKSDSQARVIIRDTGPGIPAKDVPRIFDRFYRAEKSRTRSKASGFGLGLSIVQAIVERHDGFIEVDSQEGKGTTFCVRLPIYDNTANRPLTYTVPGPSGKS